MTQWEKSIEQLKSLMKAFADPCEGKIYHYTSGEGLRGILESNEIWLTNTAFVNDATECRALQERQNLFEDSSLTNSHVEDWWRRSFSSHHSQERFSNQYIASFSKKPTSLEQFRAYGNFSIGFQADRLSGGNFNLYECVYSEAEIKNWILEKESVPEWNGDCLDDQEKASAAFNLLYAASVKFKNESYQAEEEIRLVGISNYTWEPFPNSPSMFEKDPPIHFRNHPVLRLPVPYVNIRTKRGFRAKYSYVKKGTNISP
jgi:hypothetical protein